MNTLLVAAMTADGYIARTSDHLATAWTNPEDRSVFTDIVKPAGTMVMGYTTFMTTARKSPSVFTRSMPGRRLLVYTHHPHSVAGYPAIEAVTEPPSALVQRLAGEAVDTLAVCGGTNVYTMFMAAGVVDELYIDMQATLFGTGVALFNKPLVTRIALENTRRLGDNNILLHYKVRKD